MSRQQQGQCRRRKLLRSNRGERIEPKLRWLDRDPPLCRSKGVPLRQKKKKKTGRQINEKRRQRTNDRQQRLNIPTNETSKTSTKKAEKLQRTLRSTPPTWTCFPNLRRGSNKATLPLYPTVTSPLRARLWADVQYSCVACIHVELNGDAAFRFSWSGAVYGPSGQAQPRAPAVEYVVHRKQGFQKCSVHYEQRIDETLAPLNHDVRLEFTRPSPQSRPSYKDNTALGRDQVKKCGDGGICAPRSPRNSPRKLASELAILKTPTLRCMENDLGLKSFRPTPANALSGTDMNKRHPACARLFDVFSTFPQRLTIRIHYDVLDYIAFLLVMYGWQDIFRECDKTTRDLETIYAKAVHDKVSTFEINLRKKSLPLPAYILKGTMSDVCPMMLVTMEGKVVPHEKIRTEKPQDTVADTLFDHARTQHKPVASKTEHTVSVRFDETSVGEKTGGKKVYPVQSTVDLPVSVNDVRRASVAGDKAAARFEGTTASTIHARVRERKNRIAWRARAPPKQTRARDRDEAIIHAPGGARRESVSGSKTGALMSGDVTARPEPRMRT
ncbi:hypothetical protein PR048_024453 [Dryococelus australis]|uniref:Uncharacterized protein n=1 Tax=Dryococelus australis TaxID=614101 RepID=A0ABQ9GNN9_9NEOP|nr:hypothetical protein PR048_024453 [Dryococelus australis]